ncbi:MAG: tyrosine-type recombinase/integrase [Lachnospiraceae bacterium]
MPRTGENIYKRKDGRYEGRYIKGRKESGKARYGSVYHRKYSICKELLTEAKSLHIHYQNLKVHKTGLTADFIIYWLYSIIRINVKESTFSNYVAILEKWIKPYLGSKKLSRLCKEDIQYFVGTLTEQGLSPGSVRNVFNLLSAALQSAKEYGYHFENPCEGTRLPKPEKREAKVLTLEQQKMLEEAARQNKNGLPIVLALYSGMRVGEICALTWEDVDFENKVVNVTKTIRRIQCVELDAPTKTVLVTGSPKSNQSIRDVPLPAHMLELLMKHLENSTSEFLFDFQGHSLEPRNLQYHFKSLLETAGLTDINFHALRHTYATRCLELGFPPNTLSDILGHASTKMTLDRYGHSQQAQKQESMEMLDELFCHKA